MDSDFLDFLDVLVGDRVLCCRLCCSCSPAAVLFESECVETRLLSAAVKTKNTCCLLTSSFIILIAEGTVYLV